MANERKMIDIYVYYSGRIKIEELGYTNHATQSFSFGSLDGKGVGYTCPSRRRSHYIKKAIELVKRECNEEIRAQMQIKSNMDKLLYDMEVK